LLELPVEDASGGESSGLEAAFRARALRLPRETLRLLLLAADAEAAEAEEAERGPSWLGSTTCRRWLDWRRWTRA
jgi:hypothetical protein